LECDKSLNLILPLFCIDGPLYNGISECYWTINMGQR
jgi:hypothetical protein